MDHHTTTASPMSESALTPEEAEAASLGVIRHMTSTYTVGSFRYTSLTDAVAQARRIAASPGMEA